MPVRVKQVHAVNCPSYYEKLYALIKPVLPAEICNIVSSLFRSIITKVKTASP